MEIIKKLNDSSETLKYIIKKDDVNALKNYLENFDFQSIDNKGQNVLQFLINVYNFYVPIECCKYLFSQPKAQILFSKLSAHGNNLIFELFFQDCYNPDLVKMCLDNGCDINQKKAITLESLLHYIVLHGSAQLYDLAINYGADINAKTDKTLLHYIAEFGKNNYINHKVLENIDDSLINLKDEENLTALDRLTSRIDKNEKKSIEDINALLIFKNALSARIEKINLEKNVKKIIIDTPFKPIQKI